MSSDRRTLDSDVCGLLERTDLITNDIVILTHHDKLSIQLNQDQSISQKFK